MLRVVRVGIEKRSKVWYPQSFNTLAFREDSSITWMICVRLSTKRILSRNFFVSTYYYAVQYNS